MSYNKHLEKTLERNNTRNEYFSHINNKPSFYYQYDLSYNDLENKYMSLVSELEFCKKNNNRRMEKIKVKINKMKQEHPEIVLVM